MYSTTPIFHAHCSLCICTPGGAPQSVQELIDYNAAGATEKVADSFVLWEVHVHVPVCLTELWVLRGAEKIKLVDVFVEGFKAGALVRPASAVYSARLHNVTAVNCVTNNIVLTCPMREAPTPEDRERMPEMFDDEEKCVWRGQRGK